ncbi:OrP2 [Eciton burchellii]|nr:OrP2 [Eciton burchellii]
MARERWKDDIAYAMTPFKLITWPIGVWPLQIYDVYSLIRCVFGICCAGIMMILPCIEIYMGCTDAELNVDCLMLICCGMIGMLKMILFRIYANNLTDNYGSALNDYVTIKNGNQRSVMRRHAFMGRIICYFMICSCYVSCVIISLIPLLADNEFNINATGKNFRKYPIPSRCALGYFNLPNSIYRIIYFAQTIAMMLSSNTYMGNDAMFLNIILHICGQIKILKMNFIDVDVSSPKIYDRFNVLIKRHIYLIQMAKKLAEAISFVLLMQLLISSILLCIMGFQLILSLKTDNIAMTAKSSMVLSTFLAQLLLYSFIGDYLKSQMEEVGHTIYQSAWYDFPVKLMKNVIFVLMRTQSPIALRAGNFVVVNLSTYMSILKTSASYLSVLRVMIEI